jgi:uncharacterized protein (DUF1684 family)
MKILSKIKQINMTNTNQPTPVTISESFKIEQERMKVDQALQIIRSLADLLYVEIDDRTSPLTNRLGFSAEQTLVIRTKILEQVNKL